MGAAAFWIAVAAVLITGKWFRSRNEQFKHETIRQIVDKTGEVDEEKLRELFQPPAPPPIPGMPHHHWGREPVPGSGYRAMRIIGTLLLFLGGGIAAFATAVSFMLISRNMGFSPVDAPVFFGAAAAVAVVGLGFIFSARYLPKPAPDAGDRKSPP